MAEDSRQGEAKTRGGESDGVGAIGAETVDVDLRLYALDLDAEIEGLALRCLDESALSRRERRRDVLSRRRFTIFWGVARSLLALRLGVGIGEVRLRRLRSGKPVWEAGCGEGVAFGVSHCDDRGALAMAATSALGVDLEKPRPVRSAERMLRRHGTALERAAWRALPPGRREEGFLRWWTGREAWGKAYGSGIFSSFGVGTLALDPDLPAGFIGRDRPLGHFVYDRDGSGRCVAAVAASPPRLRRRDLDAAAVGATLWRCVQENRLEPSLRESPRFG